MHKQGHKQVAAHTLNPRTLNQLRTLHLDGMVAALQDGAPTLPPANWLYAGLNDRGLR